MPSSGFAGFVGFEIESQDVKNLAKVLRKVSPELGREMRRAIRTAAKPVITDMKSEIGGNSMNATSTARTIGDPSWTSHPYDGPTGPGGITAKMQKNIRLRVSGGKVRIYAPAAESIGRIAASIDAGVHWRHPVVGNREAWVSQTGSAKGWFTDTATRHFPKVRREVQEALEDTARKLAAML